MGFILIITLVALVAGFPIAFAIGGGTFIAFLSSDLSLMSYCIALITALDSFPLMAVPFFILSGGLMEKGGISDRLVDLARLLVGKIAGGLSIVCVVSCAIFGTVSGSAVATSAAIGGIMLPEMKRTGYKPAYSAAILSVAGTIGALIPPSLVLILFGSQTGTSITELFLGGIVPGLMLTLALVITCYSCAKKRGYDAVERAVVGEKTSAFKVIKNSFFAVLMPFIILGGIYTGTFTPTEAGVVACIYATIVIMFVYRTVNAKQLYCIARDAAKLTAIAMAIVAFCVPFARLLTTLNIPIAMAEGMAALTDSKLVFLLIFNVVLLFVGMLLDATPATLLLAPVFTPIAVSYGVDPVHFGVILAFNLVVGLTTPPVGISLFVVATLSGESVTKISLESLKFLAVALVVLLVTTYVPVLSLWFR